MSRPIKPRTDFSVEIIKLNAILAVVVSDKTRPASQMDRVRNHLQAAINELASNPKT